MSYRQMQAFQRLVAGCTWSQIARLMLSVQQRGRLATNQSDYQIACEQLVLLREHAERRRFFECTPGLLHPVPWEERGGAHVVQMAM